MVIEDVAVDSTNGYIYVCEDISNGREVHEFPAISYRRHDESPLDFY
jgi:hypothetical protein